MRIVYRISKEDYVEAHNLFAANEKPGYRRVARRFMPWMGGFLIALITVNLITGADRDPIAYLPGFLIGFYFLYCGFALRRYFRRPYAKDKRFQHDFTADISENGVRVLTASSDAQVKWSGFVRYLESERIFMLFVSVFNFIVFPKRALSLGETDEFRELLQRNVTPFKNPVRS